MDDLIICGPNNKMIAIFKNQMQKVFSMSDLGLLSYYLGMEVNQVGDQITLCQKAYAAKIVEMCNMTKCNLVDTPMEERLKLTTAKDGVDGP